MQIFDVDNEKKVSSQKVQEMKNSNEMSFLNASKYYKSVILVEF